MDRYVFIAPVNSEAKGYFSTFADNKLNKAQYVSSASSVR